LFAAEGIWNLIEASGGGGPKLAIASSSREAEKIRFKIETSRCFTYTINGEELFAEQSGSKYAPENGRLLMLFIAIIAVLSAIPAWLIFRKQGGVLRGITAYVTGFLLGVVLSVFLAAALKETTFKIDVVIGVVGAVLGPGLGLAVAMGFPSKRRA
jgi:hypothetical protein